MFRRKLVKAICNGKEKEIWIISQNEDKPDWVNYGFKANMIKWTNNAQTNLAVNFNVLMNTQIVKKFKRKSQSRKIFVLGLASGYAGAYRVMFGDIGDVINLTDGVIVSARKFEQDYDLVKDSGDIFSPNKNGNHFTARQLKYFSAIVSLLEHENLDFEERRPLFLAYNSIEEGKNFGDVMRRLILDIENVQIAQKGELSPKVKLLLSDIQSDYNY